MIYTIEGGNSSQDAIGFVATVEAPDADEALERGGMIQRASNWSVFRFTQNTGGQFKLVVFAKNLKDAREYVKAQAMSSLAHRTLRFVGEGHPQNQESWCAATVRYPKGTQNA